jgi:hypothetical protein
VAGSLARSGETGDVIPERNYANAQPGLLEPPTQSVDLSALPGAIDPGKTDKPGVPVVGS